MYIKIRNNIITTLILSLILYFSFFVIIGNNIPNINRNSIIYNFVIFACVHFFMHPITYIRRINIGIIDNVVLIEIIKGNTLSLFLFYFINSLINGNNSFPLSVFLLYYIISINVLLFLVFVRKNFKHSKGINTNYKDNSSTTKTINDKNSNNFYADLLNREEVSLGINEKNNSIKNKRILITGAGGSIGSNLVIQCLNYEASEIICMDQSEEKIFNLKFRMSNYSSKTIFKYILSDINNKKDVEKVLKENMPQIVFHAAALKHVPIQEDHPWKAAETNIIGTYNIVLLSHIYFVEKFILISTDKAVNPVSYMGATKRIAEKIIQSFNIKSKTIYNAVRFGNVLGSSGSVIPIFQKQIKMGGPITITHPDIKRYFMSITEASHLILQCCSLNYNRKILILKMGKSVKIVSLAKKLIELEGLVPEKDIPIVYTGLRPGEKLNEELQYYGEKIIETPNKKIITLNQSKLNFKKVDLNGFIDKIKIAVSDIDIDEIQKLLKSEISSYKPEKRKKLINSNHVNYVIKGEA